MSDWDDIEAENAANADAEERQRQDDYDREIGIAQVMADQEDDDYRHAQERRS